MNSNDDEESDESNCNNNSSSSSTNSWQYCPLKQAQLRDEALGKILLKGNHAGYCSNLRLSSQEVLVRDSKKTGYFPARLVCKDNASQLCPPDHVRIHYDGRPEGEYRDVPSAFVHYLQPNDNDNDDDCGYGCHLNILLSPWVLLDEVHNFENTPLLAYSKVFERTEFRKIRVLFDGSFELMDRLGRIVKVKPEWVQKHSTVHPDALEEAIAAAKIHEDFLDLVYGATGGKSNQQQLTTTTTIKGSSSSSLGPPVVYGNQNGQSYWLPAAFASAIHAYAGDMQLPQLEDCARIIFHKGKQLKIDSKLRTNFCELVNHITNPIGYRMKALRFFDVLHQCHEARSAPVVASVCLSGKNGRCISFYQNWIFEPTQQYALERTPEGLQQLFGKGDHYSNHHGKNHAVLFSTIRITLVTKSSTSSSESSGKWFIVEKEVSKSKTFPWWW